MHNKYKFIITLITALSLSGCGSLPNHSNTLLFATNTSFGVNVAPNATNLFSIDVGYRRQEGVWMPLLANKDLPHGVEAADCENDDKLGNSCKFIGVSDDGKSIDTYSVLASFGGEASAGGGSDGAEAEVEIIQYFATGLAARELAKNAGAAAVNTDAPPAKADVKDNRVSRRQRDLANELSDVNLIMSEISGTDGSLDQAKCNNLADKAASNHGLSAGDRNAIKRRCANNSADAVRGYMLTRAFAVTQPLKDSI